MDELKPCPFCGSTESLSFVQPYREVVVRCNSGRAQGLDCGEGPPRGSREMAANAWNRREEPCHDPTK